MPDILFILLIPHFLVFERLNRIFIHAVLLGFIWDKREWEQRIIVWGAGTVAGYLCLLPFPGFDELLRGWIAGGYGLVSAALFEPGHNEWRG